MCFHFSVPLLVLAASSSALFPSSSDVVELTPANFDRLVTQSDSLWIVEFYAPWCGHCKNLVPEYSAAAKALKGVVKVGAVDADAHKALGGQFDVRGFPTIKMFGIDKNKPSDFVGDRTVKGFVDAAFAAMKSRVNAQMGGSKVLYFYPLTSLTSCRPLFVICLVLYPCGLVA